MTLLDALQQSLALEHAAVYGYGLLGARLSGTELATAQAAYAAHEARRDTIARLVRDRGGAPVVAQPAYLPRHPVTDRRSAMRLAVALEDEGSAAYVAVVGATTDTDVRRAAVGWLTDATVRSQDWRGRLGPSVLAALDPLPGLVGVAPTLSPTPSP